MSWQKYWAQNWCSTCSISDDIEEFDFVNNAWFHQNFCFSHFVWENDYFFQKMAPGKNEKKNSSRYVKESILFKYCQKGLVPPSYTSLHACERNFGLKYSVSQPKTFLMWPFNSAIILGPWPVWGWEGYLGSQERSAGLLPSTWGRHLTPLLIGEEEVGGRGRIRKLSLQFAAHTMQRLLSLNLFFFIDRLLLVSTIGLLTLSSLTTGYLLTSWRDALREEEVNLMASSTASRLKGGSGRKR